MELTKEELGMASSRRAARLRRDLDPLYALAAAVFIAVGSWYLLKELAPLLRPLVLAVFLAYTIQPAHQAVRQRVHAKFAGPLLALLMAMALLGLALLVYTNLVDLRVCSKSPMLWSVSVVACTETDPGTSPRSADGASTESC